MMFCKEPLNLPLGWHMSGMTDQSKDLYAVMIPVFEAT